MIALHFSTFPIGFFYRAKTPLDTIEVTDTCYGRMLATPYLDTDYKESGDRCVFVGAGEGSVLWTEKCNQSSEWLAWEFRPVDGNSNKFQLVQTRTGRCVKAENKKGSWPRATNCNNCDSDLIWSWYDGSIRKHLFDWNLVMNLKCSCSSCDVSLNGKKNYVLFLHSFCC